MARGEKTKTTHPSEEAKLSNFTEVLDRSGIDINDESSIDSYMRGRGYKESSIRAVKRGARQLQKNRNGRTFHLTQGSGFRIFDEGGNEVTREGRASGNRKGFGLGDLVGLGKNVSSLAALVRAADNEQKAELDSLVNDVNARKDELNKQFMRDQLKVKTNIPDTLPGLRTPASSGGSGSKGSDTKSTNDEAPEFTGTKNFRGDINAFNETTGSKPGRNFRGQAAKVKGPLDHLLDLSVLAPEGSPVAANFVGGRPEPEEQATTDPLVSFGGAPMLHTVADAGRRTPGLIENTVQNYDEWRKRQKAISDKQKAATFDFLKRLTDISDIGENIKKSRRTGVKSN